MVVVQVWLHLEGYHTSQAENGQARARSGALGQRDCRHTRTKTVGAEGQMKAVSNPIVGAVPCVGGILGIQTAAKTAPRSACPGTPSRRGLGQQWSP